MDATSEALHVVFGAGQVGLPLAEVLLARGHWVRLVRRGAPGPAQPRLQWLQGDVTAPGFAEEAARGASVVYDCTGTRDYHRWEEVVVPMVRAVRGAAARAGARLVVLDNLYMYGRPPAQGWDEDTPVRPCSRKGELRARLAEELFAAHARGEVRACAGRAPDYFGPGAERASVFGERFTERVGQGRAITVDALGDPDQPHSYAFIPDVARGLAALGEREEAMGKVWHLPVAWQGTTRELMQALADQLGVVLAVRKVPDLALRAVGLFNPIVAAVVEMTYQWKAPFILDDRRFRTAFGVEPTLATEAVAATAAWLRAQSRRAA